MYYVYILQSDRDGRYYTGMAKDVNARLSEHNAGKSQATARILSCILALSTQLHSR